MLLTDPPYNVDYQGTAGKIKNDHMEDSKFRAFLATAFRNAGMLVRQCLIWVKSSLALGRQDFQWKHEPCLYGELPGEILEEPPLRGSRRMPALPLRLAEWEALFLPQPQADDRDVF